LKTVLLIEDSRFMRLANERALVKAGFKVLTAADGEEALQITSTMVPDLIFLDMLLPKLGGPDVLKALRENPQTASIPVVVVSSLSQKNEIVLKRDGATAYFEKSKLELDQNPDSIVQVARQALEGSQKRSTDVPTLRRGAACGQSD
jgi:chemosensory pili system protein ChpA (sensor histidine kinase/response regulator)